MWICLTLFGIGGAIFTTGHEIGRLKEENRHLEEENRKLKYNSRKNKLLSVFGVIKNDFDVEDCFAILKAVAQEVCPTVVSMVYDVNCRTVYWCQHRQWTNIHTHKFHFT